MPSAPAPKAKPPAKSAATSAAKRPAKRPAGRTVKRPVTRAAQPAPDAPAAAPHWTVTLQPGTNVAQAARALHAAGLAISDKLDAIGVINGSAPQRLLGRLRQVAGVADVSPLLGFDIGPPDSALS